MGMFSRITDIVNANINALLDKAEDPQKMLRLVIQEMEETLVEVRSSSAKWIAEQKDLDRQIAAVNAQADDWQSKAEKALRNDREDLAKAALVEKQTMTEKSAALTESKTQIEGNLNKLNEDIARLNAKLEEAKAKQKQLIQRNASASVRLKVKQKSESQRIENVMVKFEDYERKIDELEAQVEAYDMGTQPTGLKAEIDALETDDEIAKQLEAMKQKLAKKTKKAA